MKWRLRSGFGRLRRRSTSVSPGCLQVCWLVFALTSWCGPAAAQPYPAQAIRLIVPFTPGGGTDAVARLVADDLQKLEGWNVVVDNKAGAGGNIGMDAVAKARPDAYTLGMGQTSTLAINPALYARMPYDTLKDVVPVALVATQPMVVVVSADSPHRTLAALVAVGRSRPGKLTQALAGTGTVGHLAGELFAARAGFTLTNVPYKGAAPALQDLVGGQTDFMFATPQAVLGLIKGGRLRALAVTSRSRLPVLPDVPTVDESGYPGFEASDWKALVVPAGTPLALMRRLHDAVERSLGQTRTLARLLAEGSAPMHASLDEAQRYVQAEHRRWGTAVRSAGVPPS